MVHTSSPGSPWRFRLGAIAKSHAESRSSSLPTAAGTPYNLGCMLQSPSQRTLLRTASVHRLPPPAGVATWWVLAAMLLGAGGCNWKIDWDWWRPKPPALPAINVWPVNEMEKVSSLTPRRQDDLLINPAAGGIDPQGVLCMGLFAAANETVCFQLVVQADAQPLQGLRLSFTDLSAGKGKIAAGHIKAFRMLPMAIAEYPAWFLRLAESAPAPADYYDAMVPLEAPGAGQPYQLAAGQRAVFWVDVYVPRGTAADEYTGEVTCSAEGAATWRARLQVRVYDLVLPDARAVAAVGGFDYRTLFGRLIRDEQGKGFAPPFLDRRDARVRRGLVAMRQLMQMGHDHRLDLFEKGMRPLLKRDGLGRLLLDWEDYDAIVGPYLDGSAFADRVGCPAWPSPFCQEWPDPVPYGGVEDAAYLQTAKNLLALCRMHFAESDSRGQLFLWPCRGKVGPEEYGRFLRLARMIREEDDQTPILSELPADPPRGAGWKVPGDFAQFASIVAPPSEWLAPSYKPPPAGAKGFLYGTWLAPGFPPHFPSLGVLAGAADLRAIPWLALKYGCPGLLVPEVLDWGEAPFSAAASTQTTLFYPGDVAGVEGVLPSVRLKWLRRGLQDLAYLQVLRQRGEGDVVRRVTDALVRYAGVEAAGDYYLDARLDGWVRDAAVWTVARRILAEEAQQAVNPAERTQAQLLALSLAWQELRRKTSGLRLEQARTSLAAVRHEGGGEHLVATLLLDLFNECDQPAAPVLRVGPLPPGWECLDGPEVRLDPIPPLTSRKVVLSLKGPEIPFTPAGKWEVPLSIVLPAASGDSTGPEARAQNVSVAVPALLAQPVSRPPVIDGDLSDWPARAGNVAGAFALLGRRGHLDKALARRPTEAFLLCDSRNLYIAIRCHEPNMSDLVSESDNVVRYEQLMACGEDLVEVLLDPGGQARGAEELYHVLVKPSGIVVAERGVGALTGKAGPWASGARVAVRRSDDDWVVEMAIPLASFGPARPERFWGVNFARFAAVGQESSNWAQAARYLYHPKNLGTMYLPPAASAAEPPLPASRAEPPAAAPDRAKETPDGK